MLIYLLRKWKINNYFLKGYKAYKKMIISYNIILALIKHV